MVIVFFSSYHISIEWLLIVQHLRKRYWNNSYCFCRDQGNNGTPHPGALPLQLVTYHRLYCFSTGVAVAVRCRFWHLAEFQLPNTILLEFNFPFGKDNVEMDCILFLLVATIPLFHCCWCCWCCTISCGTLQFHSTQ